MSYALPAGTSPGLHLWAAGTLPLAKPSAAAAPATSPATAPAQGANPDTDAGPGAKRRGDVVQKAGDFIKNDVLSAADADDPLEQAIATALDSGNSGYTPDDFVAELGAMDGADKTRLLEIVNEGEVSIQDAATMVGQFQRYYGGDNRATASALRELYYPQVLDPFVQGADSVDGAVLDLNRGVQRGDAASRSDAALAQAVFKLSVQGENYSEESVQITDTGGGAQTGPGRSVGFDHLIAGLDGRMNPTAGGPNDAAIRAGVSVLGGNPSEIRSVDAVTWLGDVAATVQIGAEQLADPQRVGERLTERSLLEQIFMGNNSVNPEVMQRQLGPAAAAGWDKEAPFEDRLGDIIGTGLQVDPDAHTLGADIASAFDADSATFDNRYRSFADDVGLRYDPVTGAVSDADKQAFIDRYAANLDALGTGLYIKGRPGAATVFPEVLGATRDLARTNLDRWVEEIESGLMNETPS
jgi:hypothetical protein